MGTNLLICRLEGEIMEYLYFSYFLQKLSHALRYPTSLVKTLVNLLFVSWACCFKVVLMTA